MTREETNIKLQMCLSRHPDNLFPPAACIYVCECVYKAIKKVDTPRHITAFEVMETFKSCCIEDFGPWAAVVLDRWHISCCLDIGRIVFLLVEAGILAACPEDKLEDFDLPDTALVPGCPVLEPPEEEVFWEGDTID